jgi:kanamycin kinase
MLTRVKGHGRRATYAMRNFRGDPVWHVKLRPGRERGVLANEAQRINWARRKTTLPVSPSAATVGSPYLGLLFTRTLEGVPAHHLIFTLGPVRLVHALSESMKQVQAVSATDFPFSPPDWAHDKAASLDRIHQLNELRRNGKKLHPGFDELSEKELISVIEQGPDSYKGRVFVHGDLCMPNMLMSQDGKFTGLIDLGTLHTGDATLDIALLAWCINDNLGPKWADYFLGLHGYSSDDPNIQFYRLAYDLSLNFPNPWGWTMAPKLVKRRSELEGVKI